MAIVVTCPSCGQQASAPDSLAGKRAKCVKCGGIVAVPAAVPLTPLEAPIPLASADDPLGIGTLPPTRTPAALLRPTPLGHGNFQASEAGDWRPSQGLRWLVMGGFGVVALLLLLAVVVPAALRGLRSAASSSGSSGGGSASYSTLEVSGLPVPSFPELGAGRTIVGGATVHFVDTRSVPNDLQQPGMAMRMRVYLPPGEAQPHSLPCVLIAPAGTPLIWGNDMDNDDYHDETLPYVQAGMAVIFYSLDGPGPENPQSYGPCRVPYRQFVAARGGVLNGRNALEFALQKLPQVDPARIYCAGHSSAATVSLLLAAHEPRIAACLAYAPCTDVPLRLKDMTSDWSAQSAFPGLAEFVQKTSPRNHLASYRCPLFVFHARDDSNEPFSTTESFAQALQAANAKVTFSPVNTGDHYNSMIEQGIPKGIEWLKQLPVAAALP